MIDPNEFPRRRPYTTELEDELPEDVRHKADEIAKRLADEGLRRSTGSPVKPWEDLSPDMQLLISWMRKIVQEENDELRQEIGIEHEDANRYTNQRIMSLETQLKMTQRALKTFLLYNISQVGFKPVVGADLPTEEIASTVEAAVRDWEDLSDLFGD